MAAREIGSVSIGVGGFAASFALATLVLSPPVPAQEGGQTEDPYADLPMTLNLTGKVRDFRERSVSGGHPDFEKDPDAGFGHYVGIVADQLDEDHKPVFGGTGFKIGSEWKDVDGRNVIPPRDYLDSRQTDVAGSKSAHAGGAVTNADRLRQWFRDTPGVNVSAPLTITLTRRPGSPMYTFDDKQVQEYIDRGGFFPINGELFGNSAGENRNFHFTYELSMNFVYKRGQGQVFTFTGDDDVWVFVDDKLVIDLGGVHAAVSQTIDLDRCNWLENNQMYKLRFFFAERHRTQSNFRIDTTISLRPAPLPTVTGLYD